MKPSSGAVIVRTSESRMLTPYAVVVARIITVPGRMADTIPVAGSTVARLRSDDVKCATTPSIGASWASTACNVSIFVPARCSGSVAATFALSPGEGWMENRASAGGAAASVTAT